MFVLVEDRREVGVAYVAGFEREGVSVLHLECHTFKEWIECLGPDELAAVEAVIVGDVGEQRLEIGGIIASRCEAPLIALLDRRTLSETLQLLNAGFDDVVGKPVHAQEFIARANTIQRRGRAETGGGSELAVFADGRDPIVGGEIMQLPRRELRILECLVKNRSAWLTKSQIFGRVYGIFNDTLDESVIESHVCRLRRRLRLRLGYDPIESQRFLGYRLVLKSGSDSAGEVFGAIDHVDASSVQPLRVKVKMQECCTAEG